VAWGFITELPISLEEYDRVDSAIEGEPDGLILHTSSEKNGRVRVIDVWESKDAYERFEREKLMPAMERIGAEPPAGGPPPRDEFDVHNIRGPAAR
jgi:heme-degrading monooxygenase HmoA